MEDLLRRSATQMARAIREREVSPVELVEAHIARAEKANGEINALVLPRFEQALEEAREAEAVLDGSGDIGPLHGVPFTAKESIEVAGMPCTDGSKLLQGNVSTEDAVVIRNLRGAGAILLGKTNIPELAIHYDSNNLVYGATHNPHMHGRTAGGSSGGEGAAIATGMSAFGVGSDYGGSIRIPCNFCGVVGIRPGRWIVPYKGHSPAAHPMSVQLASEIGPMARYVEDLELLLPIFAQPDLASDPDVYGAQLEPASAAGLRVAAFEEDGLTPVVGEVREAVRAAARALADAGHEIVEERPAEPGRGARVLPDGRPVARSALSCGRSSSRTPTSCLRSCATCSRRRSTARNSTSLATSARWRGVSSSSVLSARGWSATRSQFARLRPRRPSRSAPR